MARVVMDFEVLLLSGGRDVGALVAHGMAGEHSLDVRADRAIGLLSDDFEDGAILDGPEIDVMDQRYVDTS